MGLSTWFRAVYTRSGYIAWQHQAMQDLTNRVHRLEIAHRELKDHFELLDAAHERLLAKWKGGLGGRPAAKQTGTPSQLSMIPVGDKAGLRAYFRTNPPARDNELLQEQR